MRKSKGESRRRAQIEANENFLQSKTISGYDPRGDYQQQQVELEHAKEQKKHNRKKQKRTVLLCFAIILGLTIFVLSQITAVLMGVDYTDSTISRELDEEYLGAANQYLIEHPSERLAWSRRNDSLSNYIQAHYPEVGNAEIIGGFGVGKLYLKIRQPVAVWSTSTEKNFVDKNGVVFNKNYFHDPSITIEDRSSSGMISQRFLEFIGKVISDIESSGVGQVEKVIIPAKSIRYVEITLSGRNYPIKIQTDRDASSQTTDVVNMIKYLDENSISPSYVDVRVKSRGFWR